MNSQILKLAINQEDGSMPGEGLTALETFTYFFLAPAGLFIIISLIVYLAVRPKYVRGSAGRAITKIN